MKPNAAIILACSPALAGTIDPAVGDAQYLRYAEGFAPYTVTLEETNADGRLQVATAVLIADHWAVTAAHVVTGCTGIKVNGKPVVEAVVHPKWADVFGEHDIALLRCDEPFGLKFYPPLATRRYDAGTVVSIAGYGCAGPLSSGFTAADGRLRAGTNTIQRYEGHMLVCRLQRGSSPLEIGIAPGDWGGPVFANGELVGINSMTFAGRGPLASKDGEESGHTDVFEFREWIQAVTSAQ